MEQTEMNYRFLRGKILEKCSTQAVFAQKLGISLQELNKKLNNKGYFSQNQVYDAVEILELNDEEIKKCFFSRK